MEVVAQSAKSGLPAGTNFDFGKELDAKRSQEVY